MPTYEFKCPDGHEFEKFYRKISDAVFELPCPECGKPAARQVSGGAGLLFKGSGFYLTDYGKNAHRKAGPTSSGGEKKGGESKAGESAPGGESKPSESKPSESKASETKSTETKPASDAASAKKRSSGTNKSDT
jgi:putative FmdB family regulatory protein